MSNVKDVFAVEEAFENLLLPAIRVALDRGKKNYKTAWKDHIDPNASTLENVKHTYDIHAQTRILQAFEHLDYGDLEGFYLKMGSAVGYLANCCLKAQYLLEKGEDDG